MGYENEIDKLFKNTLEDADFSVIPQAYLNDINKRLDDYSDRTGKSVKSGKAKYLWAISIVGVISIGLLYVLNKNVQVQEDVVINPVVDKAIVLKEEQIENSNPKSVVGLAETEQGKSKDISSSHVEIISSSLSENKSIEVKGNYKVKDIEMLGVISGSIKYIFHSSGANIIDRSADFSSLRSKKKLTKGQIQKNIHDIDLYSKIIEHNPNDEYAYCNRGVSKEILHDYKGAVADFSKVIKLNPKFINAYYNRANAFMKLKDYNAAIKDFSKAIELDPDFAEAYNNRGFSKEVLQKSKEAESDYTKAIAINPVYIEAYYNRGVTKESLKDKKGAIADYSKVIELDSGVEEAYYNRGFIKTQFEDYEGALYDFTKTIEINPYNGINYVQRGYTKRLLKDSAGACADWSKAVDLGAFSSDLLNEFCK